MSEAFRDCEVCRSDPFLCPFAQYGFDGCGYPIANWLRALGIDEGQRKGAIEYASWLAHGRSA